MLPSNCSSSFWQRFCYDLGRLRSWWSWSTPLGSLGKLTQKVHKHQSQMATFHHISIYLLVTLIDFYGIFLHCWVIPFFLLRVSIPFDDHDGNTSPRFIAPDFGLWAAVVVGSGLKPMVPKVRNEETPWKFNIDTKQWPSGQVTPISLPNISHTWKVSSVSVNCTELADGFNLFDQHWPTSRNLPQVKIFTTLCTMALTRSDLLEFQTGKLLLLILDWKFTASTITTNKCHSCDLYSLSVWSSSILLNFLVKSYHFGNFPLLGSPDFGASWGYDCVSAACFDSLPTQNLQMLIEKHRDSGPPRKNTTNDFTPSWVKCVGDVFFDWMSSGGWFVGFDL